MQKNEIICNKWSKIENITDNLEYLPENMEEVEMRIKHQVKFTKYTEKNAMTIQIRFFRKLLQNSEIGLEKCNKRLQTNLSDQEKEDIISQKNDYKKNIKYLKSAIKGVREQLQEVDEGTYNNMISGSNWLKNQMREILNLKKELNK